MILLLACTATTSTPSPDTGRPDPGDGAPTAADSASLSGWDTASTYTGASSGFTAEQVVAGIDDALVPGFPDPWGLLDSLDSVSREGDPNTCPGGHDRNYNSGMGGCEASTGWIFGGLTIFESANDGTNTFQLTGDAWALSPEGERWVGAGESEFVDGGSSGFSFEVAGTWGSEFDRSWTAGQPSVGLVLVGDGLGLEVNGGLSTRGNTVYLDRYRYDTAAGTTGRILLRDPLGAWYTLDFGADGDACGEVWLDETMLGLGCPVAEVAAQNLRSRMGLPA